MTMFCGHVDELGWDKVPDVSMMETTVGPEWSQELSDEGSLMFDSVLESDRDPLAGGASLGLEPSCMPCGDSLDREILRHGCVHGCGVGCGHVVHRSPVVSMLEIPRSSEALAPSASKRLLHVAPPPHHHCLAFDRAEREKQRETAGSMGLKMLHPVTRRKFDSLRQAGGFPRRRLVTSNPACSKAVVTPRQLLFQENTVAPSPRSLNVDVPDIVSFGEERLAEDPTGLKFFFPASARAVP
jgi:hypothetical protein